MSAVFETNPLGGDLIHGQTQQRQCSHLIVGTAAASAAGIAANPIPFSDCFLLVPVQVGMLAGITATYGLSLSEGFLSTLVGSTVGATVATISGRALVGALLKLIPGPGSAIGGAIAAVAAGALTTAFGEAYIATLDTPFVRHGGEPPSQHEVAEELRRRLRKG